MCLTRIIYIARLPHQQPLQLQRQKKQQPLHIQLKQILEILLVEEFNSTNLFML